MTLGAGQMAYRELMGWIPATKRWQKRVPVGMERAGTIRYAGQRELKRLYPKLFIDATRSGSRDAANQFWTDFVTLNNINLQMFDDAIKERELILQAELHRRNEYEQDNILPVGNGARFWVSDQLGMKPAPYMELLEQLHALKEFKGKCEYQNLQLPDMPTYKILFPDKPLKKKESLSFLIDDKISVLECRTKLKRTNKKSLTKKGFSNLKRLLKTILECLGDIDINDLNEPEVKKYRAFINDRDIKEKTKIDYWVYFKEFVTSVCEDDIKDRLPKNLSKKDLIFCADKSTTIVPSVADAKYVLGRLREDGETKLELIVLLCLNCGMYNRDISHLLKSAVDLKSGTLTYKRSKADKHEQIEPVDYPLWGRTSELLTMLQCDDDDYWLDVGRLHDKIGREYRDYKKAHLPKITYQKLMDFRKTANTELEELGATAKLCDQFLQHGATDTTGEYYSGRSTERFLKAVRELGEVFCEE